MPPRKREEILEELKKLRTDYQSVTTDLLLDCVLEVLFDIRDQKQEDLKILQRHTEAMTDLARAIRLMPTTIHVRP